MIELIDNIKILKEANKDSWGISVSSSEPISMSCRVMYTLQSEPLKSVTGEFINPTAKVYFGGLVSIEFTDRLIFLDDFGEERTFTVHEVKPIKDFSGIVMFTRVVV
jgi:hypothetical protein